MRARPRIFAAAVIVVMTLGGAPPPARADDPPSIPGELFSLAEAYRLNGRFKLARQTYRRFLREARADDPRRTEARRLVSMIDRALLQRAVARADERGELDDDRAGSAFDRSMFGGSLAVTAVSLAAIVYGQGQIAAAEDDIAIALARSEHLDVWGTALDAGADGCAAAGYNVVADTDPETARVVASACRSGDRWAKVSAVAIPFAVIGAVTTGVFGYFTFRGERADESGIRLAPTVSPTGAGAQVELDF